MFIEGSLDKRACVHSCISVPFGTPMTHKKIEEIQRAMNEQKV
jgi:hypothetical protein